jgi:hypothetical protein
MPARFYFQRMRSTHAREGPGANGSPKYRVSESTERTSSWSATAAGHGLDERILREQFGGY